MKYLLVFTLALAMPVFARTIEAADDKATITKLEQEWPAAVVNKDTAKILSLGSPDCWFTEPSGQITPLKDIAANVKSGAYTVRSMHIDELKVRVNGDTGVVFGLETEKSNYKGKDTSGQYRFVDTWVKRNDRWFCVASANTRIPSAKH